MRKKVQYNSGVFVPSCITPFKNVILAIDNTDLQIDTPDGQPQLHCTAMAIFQEGEAEAQKQKMEFERSSRLRKKSGQETLHQPLFCSEPKKEKVENFSYTSDRSTLDVFHKHDIVWSMMKSQLDLAKLVPT